LYVLMVVKGSGIPRRQLSAFVAVSLPRGLRVADGQDMWTDDDVLEAIRNEPAAAGKALDSLPWNGLKPLTPEALELVATTLGHDYAQTWIDQLDNRDLLGAFAHALLAQGVALEGEPEVQGIEWGDHVDPRETSRFMLRASTARCRVFVNGAYRGSGCLLGPSLC
jgi:hypothetical protein